MNAEIQAILSRYDLPNSVLLGDLSGHLTGDELARVHYLLKYPNEKTEPKGGRQAMSDIGNRCVHCGEDTSFGSGRFVNRIPADADYEATDSEGKIIFADGEYRDGYACPDCSGFDCDRCDEMIYIDEDLTPDCVYDCDTDDRANGDFSDGAFRVHEKCLTKQERTVYKRNRELGVV